MNEDAQLKLQAFLDKELPENEAAEVKKWLETDREGRLLLTELQNTSACLLGCEANLTHPESREFFWSKIEREIQKAGIPEKVERKLSFLDRLRRQLVPLSGFAIVTMVFSVVAIHSLGGKGKSAEMEMLSDEMGAYTFRDQANKMTFVWFYDRSDSAQADENDNSDSVLTQ